MNLIDDTEVYVLKYIIILGNSSPTTIVFWYRHTVEDKSKTP